MKAKKLLSGVLAFIMLAGTCSIPAFADDEPENSTTSNVYAATLHDNRSENAIADEDLCSDYSVSVTEPVGEDTVTEVKISAKNLKQHTNGNGTEGYWVGFALTAPEGAAKMKYAFSADENLTIGEDVCDLEANVHGEESGIAFYADAAAAAPKTFALVQWYAEDGHELTSVLKYSMDLSGVSLAKADNIFTAPLQDSDAPDTVLYDADSYSVDFTAPENGVTRVAVSAKNLKQHTNGNGTEGYWVGFALTAPEGAAKMKYAFSADENLTIGEDVCDLEANVHGEESGIAFYADASLADAKTFALVQWLDGNGDALTSVLKYSMDLSGVSLDGLPYIGADSVKKANIVDQTNTAAAPFTSNSVTAAVGEDSSVTVAVKTTGLKSHTNGEGTKGYWTGFAVTAPEGAAKMKYAFSADGKAALSAPIDLEESVFEASNGIAFFVNMNASATRTYYASVQWFDENGLAMSNITKFIVDMSGVRRYSTSGGHGGGSSSSKNNASDSKKDEDVKKPEDEKKDEQTPASDGWANPFGDVKKDSWFYEVVKKAYTSGLMKGMSEDGFAPNAALTRGMFVTVLYRMAGEPETAAQNFSDVAAGQYYEKAIAWASANGIVNGISDTEFAPESNVTREQMAAMIYRYAKFKNADLTAQGSLDYSDAASVSEYAKDAVLWDRTAGIMMGNADGSFAANANATRAEAAAVFVRALEKLK